MPWHQKRVLERARVQRQSVLRDRKSRIRRERQFRSVPSVRSIARPAHLLSLKRAARKQAPWRCAAAWSQRRPSSIGAYVDTGFACSPARDPQTLVVTAPPSGTISVGGYCFRQSQIEAAVVQADPKATIVVLPDGRSRATPRRHRGRPRSLTEWVAGARCQSAVVGGLRTAAPPKAA